MLDKDKFENIVTSAALDVIQGGEPKRIKAHAIMACSRIALGLPPEVDIVDLPDETREDLLMVMRSVRVAVTSIPLSPEV